MTEHPLLSVVITSYSMDRLGDILELLDSIKDQDYANIETIVVIERSRELLELVTVHGEKEHIPGLKVIFNDGEPGASSARNLGITHSQGEIIAFVDDDAIVYPNWAQEMMATYADEQVIGVTGPAFPLWKGKPAEWFPEEFYWILSCTSWTSWDRPTKVRNIWLQNGSFRREAFQKAGALNPVLGPQDSTGGFKNREFKKGTVSEEVELSIRVRKATNKTIVYNPEVRIKHRVDERRLAWDYITKWSYWVGFSKRKLEKLYATSGADVLGQERQLLKRIITKLLPNIFKTSFTHPVIAWRKFQVTMSVLCCISAGYYSPRLLFWENRSKEGE